MGAYHLGAYHMGVYHLGAYHYGAYHLEAYHFRDNQLHAHKHVLTRICNVQQFVYILSAVCLHCQLFVYILSAVDFFGH